MKRMKKWALTLAATALLGSFSTPAWAAPQQGFYINGEVDRYYSITSFVKNFEQALEEITDAGFGETIYVSDDATGATILEVVDEGSLFDALHELTAGDFEANGYTEIDENGDELDLVFPGAELGGGDDFDVIDIE
ncbi:hypothetical protein LOK74_18885 [Brevibacillus humidisoli]|uniref:hypothetical protein n=1 Tax=Brevibacillus humidisoli TaxID=2895522 RepID=UPI001E323055|nr:hypothetical protein [Brevibacillus humidisoli]UFJ40079.1 hypothetical protein LOK74_18885 [Brevibacillus humidisoli]